MSDWYFEKNGERGGPVSADELKAMLASGAIGLANLVWTAAFGREWKRVGDTELAPPAPVMPPPLPGSEPPALPQSVERTDTAWTEAFLASELTKALIGKKQDHYLGKWRTLLAKAGGDPAKIATISSWNWPALFFPYGWLFYRKMYVLGGIVLAFQLAYVLLPESAPASAARLLMISLFSLGIAFASYGNAWYLEKIRKRWEALRVEPDQAAALAKAKQDGGVNLVAPIVTFTLIVAAAIGPHVISWNDPAALVRDGHMRAYPSTTVGKAFAGNFDGGSWRSFTTAKGQQVVEFNGKINAALHGNAVTLLIDSFEKARKAGRSKAESDLLELNYLLSLFQLAHRHLDGKPELAKLQQKWGCDKIERSNLDGVNTAMMPKCNEHTTSFLVDAIGEWAEQAHWQVGTPVTVQWTINVDGKGFEVSHMASPAWQGLDHDNVLDLLFQ